MPFRLIGCSEDFKELNHVVVPIVKLAERRHFGNVKLLLILQQAVEDSCAILSLMIEW